jgi:hypothetical protein
MDLKWQWPLGPLGRCRIFEADSNRQPVNSDFISCHHFISGQ